MPAKAPLGMENFGSSFRDRALSGIGVQGLFSAAWAVASCFAAGFSFSAARATAPIAASASAAQKISRRCANRMNSLSSMKVFQFNARERRLLAQQKIGWTASRSDDVG